MISKLSVENFKSIIKTQVNLQPLTVLVGANGSGKSNLIKVIEFIATIAQNGLLGAVDQFGSFESIIPKAIPENNISNTLINIDYCMNLPHLKNYPKNKPPICVKHHMELAYSKAESIRMNNELLEFDDPISVAELYLKDFKIKDIDKDILFGDSFIKLMRGPRGAINYESSPSFAKDLPRFLRWFGFPMFEDAISSKKSLIDLLKKVTGQVSGTTNYRKNKYQSFLDPSNTHYTGFSVEADIFRHMISNTKRYDLLLSELRQEQQIVSTDVLATGGENIPSVLRNLKKSGEDSWKRLMKTMSVIAPHVSNLDSKKMRTGKEFIEFTENVTERSIESWESSDGTLRALAVLLSLETHKADSTVLLEEPERNLHPWAVREIIEHMREVIKEKNLQVILTTHSPQVLERVNPEEVLVASRSLDRGTTFKTLNDILPKSKLVMGDVSRLWVKGLLGGTPSDVN